MLVYSIAESLGDKRHKWHQTGTERDYGRHGPSDVVWHPTELILVSTRGLGVRIEREGVYNPADFTTAALVEIIQGAVQRGLACMHAVKTTACLA